VWGGEYSEWNKKLLGKEGGEFDACVQNSLPGILSPEFWKLDSILLR